MGTSSPLARSRSNVVAIVVKLLANVGSRAIAWVFVACALAGCLVNTAPDPAQNAGEGEVGESGGELRAPFLRSLAIAPREASIAPGATQSFTATGTFSNGARLDVTAFVNWRSSNARVATISNAPGTKGLATGRSAGRAIITAELLGR